MTYRRTNTTRQRGQILPVFAVLLPVLILFSGLGIDVGLAYVSRATLSKAVDAACLAGMRNLNKGQSQAAALAQDAFSLNYKTSSRDANAPAFAMNFTTDANGDPVVTVNATATIKTFFMRMLPQYKTLQVSANAQATRPKLIMSLVLDRSGSMNLNGGAQALPPAVQTFIDMFDDSLDHVAMVSFSSIPTVDVPIRTYFQLPIINAANAMKFGGATFAQGGLLDAQAQINSVPATGNVIKVAVFFTDGWANTNQDTLSCGSAQTLLNYGGCSPPEAAVGWCGPGFAFMNPNTGSQVSCGATQFYSQQYKMMETLNITNISNDALYRAIQLSNQMRAQGIVVYSIGLGDKISQTFLQQIANDPNSPTFDPTQPVGEAVFAPTANDLQGVFQTIASKILLRLTQ
ncbi:MAG TPA: TadE/TadG family type IV pilus assembly protein [Terriglobales bacterium]|nr:TadE/TadG family type IV pilus assembly protein [Terriglobales bacterium]